MTSELLAEPVLVGRERQLEELQHYLDLAVQGKGTTVFVSGEAGSGKTRLVNEFLSASKRKRNTAQLKGWCLSNSGVPYFPFIEAFKVYSSGSKKKGGSSGTDPGGLEESLKGAELAAEEEMGLRAWLMGPGKTEKSRELEDLSPQAWKESTFAAVTGALFSISAKEPTLLFIDDLQWADTASLALLQYISRFILAERILVLGTFRKEDLTPDSEGHPHPLVDTLRLMGRESLYKEIKLHSLGRRDVSLLAENMVGGRVQSELAEKLTRESQGNPLFIVESLKMLSEKGDLVEQNNQWRLSRDEIAIPAKFRDIILRRVGVLNLNQRKILDLASVIGSRFDPELLGSVLSQDSFNIINTLNDIEKSTSLVTCEADNYRFDHAKIRDALYEEISGPMKKAYHGRVADRLESMLKVEKLPVADLAFHYAQAGNKEKAVKYALAAGEEALSALSASEAIKNFSYIRDATEGDDNYTVERTAALEGLGDSLLATGRCKEATQVFENLSNNATSELVKMRAMRKSIHASLILGMYAKALETANEAVENQELDRLEYARMHLFKAIVDAWGAKFAQSIDGMKEALKILEEEYSLPDMSYLLGEMGPPYVSANQHEKGVAAAIRGVALSEYSNSFDRGRSANVYLAITFALCNLEKQSSEALEEILKTAEKISDPISRVNHLCYYYFMSGQVLEIKAAQRLFSGLPLDSMRSFGTGAKIKFLMSSLISGAMSDFKQGLKSAIAQSLKCLEFAEETDSYTLRVYAYGNLARQYAALGDMKNAEKHYDMLAKITEEAPMAGGFAGWGTAMLSKAAYFSAKNQWKKANQSYEEALEVHTKAAAENAFLAGLRQNYCSALLQQGRFAEAKIQFEKAKETLETLEKRFMHSNVLGYFMAPKNVEVGTEFNMRLDLINVAKEPGVLVKVENLTLGEFNVTVVQPKHNIENGKIDFEEKTINPFTDEVVTLTVKGTKVGVFSLKPRLVYLDDLGETKTCNITPVNVTVQPGLKSD